MSGSKQKQLRKEKLRQAAIESEPEHGISRRQWLLGGAAAAVAAAAGGIGYRYRQPSGTDDNALSATAPLSEPPPDYLSFSEAEQLYIKLRNTIKQKHDEAGERPFKVFFLESHESPNALAYELMGLDIMKKMNIKTLLVELPTSLTDSIRHLKNTNVQPDDVRAITHLVYDNANTILAAALRNGFELVPMDKKYGTPEEFYESGYQKIKAGIYKELVSNHPDINPDIITRVYSPTNDLNVQIEFNHALLQTLSSSSRKKLDGILRNAIFRAMDELNTDRNDIMKQVVTSYRAAMVDTGFRHGMDLISSSRDSGGIDASFNICNDVARTSSPILTPGDAANAAWVESHTTPHTGKNFYPPHLERFVSRVCERAEKTLSLGTP